jgi:hypothetical protein
MWMIFHMLAIQPYHTGRCSNLILHFTQNVEYNLEYLNLLKSLKVERYPIPRFCTDDRCSLSRLGAPHSHASLYLSSISFSLPQMLHLMSKKKIKLL